MFKKILIFLLSVVLAHSTIGQLSNNGINELKEQLLKAKHDSVRSRLFIDLAYGYRFSNIDSSLFYADRSIDLANKNNLLMIKAQMLSLKGATVLEAGKLPESLQLQFEALGIGEKIKDSSVIAYALNRIGNIYMELTDYRKANEYYSLSKDLFQQIGDVGMYHNEVSNIGNVYYLMQLPDSALFYLQIVYDASLKTSNRLNYTRPEIMFRLGNAYNIKGDKAKALYYYQKGVVESNIDNDLRNLTMNNLLIAKLYKEMNLPDSSLKYAYHSLQTGEVVSFRKGVFEASILISELYKNKNRYDSSYKYLARANAEKDSLTGTKRFQALQRIVLNEQERQRKTEAKRIDYQNKQKQFALLAGFAIALIVASILYINNKQKQKTNKALETALANLKSTQSQLIQSEKMASLGELTAGIAHEIQNPLNFINNFSEVNTELLEELEGEIDSTNNDVAKAITKDIKVNEQKILHHGKRADSIVKSMLQHSRLSSTATKESTDINKLADEYLRLSYHGLRAKDKTFNADYKGHFDDSIGMIEVVPQDIGRVLLNLVNNAFYSVAEKEKLGIGGYKPEVIVTTQRKKEAIVIRVRDNGIGIPQSVMDKIYQPFFTTKPTGEGTGLGLSMSYDIITKGHGGTLEVKTKEGEYAEFDILLPAYYNHANKNNSL